MSRYGMVIDLLRCIGCYGCQISCKAEHATPPGVTHARVEITESGEYPNVSRAYLPLLCQHCRDAPCERVCPTKATQRSDEGIVWIDDAKCVGCKYCVLACPYGARYVMESPKGYFGAQGLTPFESAGYGRWRDGVVSKCSFCRERVERGIKQGMTPGVDRAATPACVNNCMAKARYFGDLEDPSSVVSRIVASGQAFQLSPEHMTNPSVWYLPPGRNSGPF